MFLYRIPTNYIRVNVQAVVTMGFFTFDTSILVWNNPEVKQRWILRSDESIIQDPLRSITNAITVTSLNAK